MGSLQKMLKTVQLNEMKKECRHTKTIELRGAKLYKPVKSC